jgi:hypothetical protein
VRAEILLPHGVHRRDLGANILQVEPRGADCEAVDAGLREISDDWETDRAYLNMEAR